MKDVYIVDIAVRDCLGNNLAENYAKMAEATGQNK